MDLDQGQLGVVLTQPFCLLWRITSGRQQGVLTHLQESRMKVIRIATLAAALWVGITSAAAAQGTEPPQQGQGQGEMRRGRMGGLLLKDITLTDAQKAQVKTIREKYAPQQLELRKSAQATGAPPDEATRP